MTIFGRTIARYLAHTAEYVMKAKRAAKLERSISCITVVRMYTV
jgi:hypothetical protein